MPSTALRRIITTHGEVSNSTLAELPHHIVRHTSVKVCSIVAVEVVTVDSVNHMIRCGQTVSTQVSTFPHDYGGWGVMFLLVFLLGIPGDHGIVILLPFLPLVPIRRPYTSSPSSACSST